MLNGTTANLITLLLTVTILFQQSSFASSEPENDAALAQKVRAGILKLGTGPSSRVKLRLKDKRKLAGYITEAGDDSFVLTESESDAVSTIAYPDIAQVKGNNLSTRTKIIIGVAIAAGIAITLYIVRGAFCDGC
jgi:hypothetical protein